MASQLRLVIGFPVSRFLNLNLPCMLPLGPSTMALCILGNWLFHGRSSSCTWQYCHTWRLTCSLFCTVSPVMLDSGLMVSRIPPIIGKWFNSYAVECYPYSRYCWDPVVGKAESCRPALIPLPPWLIAQLQGCVRCYLPEWLLFLLAFLVPTPVMQPSIWLLWTIHQSYFADGYPGLGYSDRAASATLVFFYLKPFLFTETDSTNIESPPTV